MEFASDVCGAVVFLNTPGTFKVGVDYAEWFPEQRTNLTDKSSSVWVITGAPPGVHFVFWEDVHNEKHGEFLHLVQREVAVFKWSPKLALFSRVLDQDEIKRFQEGHDNLSLLTQAVVLPPKWGSAWNDVSFCLTRLGVRQIQGEGIVSQEAASVAEYSTNDHGHRQDSLFDERLKRLEGLFSWSDIPKKGPGSPTTTMDKSSILEELIRQKEEVLGDPFVTAYEKSELHTKREHLGLSDPELLLLGELQLSYLAFLLLASVDAMQQWKALLLVLSNSECLTGSRRSFAANLIRVIYGQIDQCPDDLLKAELTRSNFLIAAVVNLSELLEGVGGKLEKRMESLKRLLEKKFNMSMVEIWALQEEGPAMVSGNVFPVGANFSDGPAEELINLDWRGDISEEGGEYTREHRENNET